MDPHAVALEFHVTVSEDLHMAGFKFDEVAMGIQGFTAEIAENLNALAEALRVVRSRIFEGQFRNAAGLAHNPITLELQNAAETLTQGSPVIQFLLAQPEIQTPTPSILDAAVCLVRRYGYQGVLLVPNEIVVGILHLNIGVEFNRFQLLPGAGNGVALPGAGNGVAPNGAAGAANGAAGDGVGAAGMVWLLTVQRGMVLAAQQTRSRFSSKGSRNLLNWQSTCSAGHS